MYEWFYLFLIFKVGLQYGNVIKINKKINGFIMKKDE